MNILKTLFLAAAVSSCAVLTAAIPQLDMSKFGAGECKNPGRTYYVANDGKDTNSGADRRNAFKTLKFALAKLKAGDTLYVAGGKYYEYDLSLNNRDDVVGYNGQSGKPGAPIRVIGIAGENPVLAGGKYYAPASSKGQIAEFKLDKPPYKNMVMEYPSHIELQLVTDEALVRKYPGTFYLDEKAKRMVVHYAALEQTGIMAVQSRMGLRVCGSFIHIENLTFECYSQALYLRPNRPYSKNITSNVTVKNCNFYHNIQQGLCLHSVKNTLVTGCRFARNGYRGGLLIQPTSHDNLIYGNWGGESPMTLRQHRAYDVNYAFNQYGYTAGPRNHFIGNVMDNQLAFRWKDDAAGSYFVSNILNGTFCVQGPVKLKKHIMVNNVLNGKVSWVGIAYNAWDKDFAGTPIIFKDNVKSRKEFKPLYPIVLEAEKLAVKLPEIKFPPVRFADLKISNIEDTSCVISWKNPDADGTGRVAYKVKGADKFTYVNSAEQGSEQMIALTNLKPDTQYEFRAILINRRGKNINSKLQKFRTAKISRQPRILEVGAGKLSLKEATCMAIPGDTIKLLPGRHYGSISLQKSGLPGKPITISGKGAILDAKGFYAPMLDISNQSHIVIDGLTFDNPEITARKGIISALKTRNITVRNCRTGIDQPHDWRAGGFLNARLSENYLIENNIIWGSDYPITYSGKNVTIRQNTIVKSAMMSLIFTDTENIKIENNILYRQCVDQKTNQAMFFNGKCTNIVSDGNVFYSPLKTHPIGGRFRNLSGKVLWESPTLEAWQKKTGLDKKSIHADPMFIDVEKGNFALKAGSPAAGKGANL